MVCLPFTARVVEVIVSSTEWTQPGAHEVAAGVHRIPLPMPGDGLRAVNVYAIRNASAITLIDGGWALAESRERLAEALDGLGAGLDEVDRVLVTHVHRDHYTQAVALRAEIGCRVSLGAEEHPNLRCLTAPDSLPMGKQRAELAACGAEPVLRALNTELDQQAPLHEHHWQLPDEWLTGGCEVELADRTLRVVHTPGHTRGHVVFLDETSGLMFTGDHVLPSITPSVGLEQAPGELPLRDYLESLRAIRALPDARMLPAHGPVRDGVHSRVDELLTHHEDRLETMTATVAGGTSTAYETARALSWTRREHVLDELDPFNRTLAVLETSAHLELLVHRRRLNSRRHERVLHYTAR
ncbi:MULTISPECIES: MBL fold metallo-hydrolase [unclassified Actinopolyspora]|uniref:MBL fold metallo-hydrolase n=1 Tax=unclassified Actinopolyspora TaxID=2639451 RepID=UPI0013F5ACE6|nr:MULTISPECIES: MBL fold metallo-hydrolase [unclassified Actinopolyspora]NHD15755.1 MBL fold metallo-hydrolase [Actinopolyspora sp. BKK2]NHE75031.1 MBL fold metallo-hydrolase [Actinopolyspora sp. BKK1]